VASDALALQLRFPIAVLGFPKLARVFVLGASCRKVTLPLVRAECSLNYRLPQSGVAGCRQCYLLIRVEHGAVFVAFVQGVIRSFHENFRPFNEGGGQKTGESADQDFLEEGGVHPNLESNESASNQSLYGKYRFSGMRFADFCRDD